MSDLSVRVITNSALFYVTLLSGHPAMASFTFYYGHLTTLKQLISRGAAAVGDLCVAAPKQILSEVYHVMVYSPLHVLYFNGPSLHGYGFWAGLAPADCCAATLPGTSAVFWADHLQQCEVILDQRFVAFLTAVQFITYVAYLYRLLSLLMYRVLILSPLMRRLDHVVFEPTRGALIQVATKT